MGFAILFMLLVEMQAVEALLRMHPFGLHRTLVAIDAPLTKATLHFDFHNIPYATGVHHIHSPEHISQTHKLGAPFFHIDSVKEPKVSADGKASIGFTCSTLVTKGMRVRMFSTQPNESNLLFFKDNRALYRVRFSVIPIRAFLSHRLTLDVHFFSGSSEYRATLKSLMPIFMFINGMEDRVAMLARSTGCYYDGALANHEHPHFTQYRRAVLRGKSSDEFWIMAERVMREYSG